MNNHSLSLFDHVQVYMNHCERIKTIYILLINYLILRSIVMMAIVLYECQFPILVYL